MKTKVVSAMDQAEFSRKYIGYEDCCTTIRDKVEKLQEQSEQRKAQADSISAFMFEMHETDEPIMEFDSKLRLSVIDCVVVKHNGILFSGSETVWRLKDKRIETALGSVAIRIVVYCSSFR